MRRRLCCAASALALVAAACTSHPTPAARATPGPTTTSRSPSRTPSTSPAAVRPKPTRAPVGGVYAHTFAGDLSKAVAHARHLVYVPNSQANTVDIIDPLTYRVIDHFAVGRLPQHVTPSWDLRTLYVDNDMGNTLTPIDPRTGKRGADIPVTDPYNLYFTPDGTKAIVVAERLRRLDFRDPHTWRLIKSVPVPCRGVDHADFTPDGSMMLASCEFSAQILRIDLRQLRVTGAMVVGGSPVDVKLSPDGTVFYVANQSRNGVSVIDLASMTERRFIPTGRGAHGLYPSRDARFLYVSNRLGGSVSVIDFATQKVIATWRVGGSPDMGGVSADGSKLWLSGRYHAAVYVIDTRTGKLVHTIRVGAGAHGLCLFPQPGRFSLGHTGVYR